MPGRQAHGRPLTAAPKSAPKKNSSKARSQKNALNAFGIAQENFASKPKLTPRARELDAQVERKHGREAEEDPASEDDIEDGPQRKKAKSSKGGVGGGEVDYGSDSEGNEWQLGGMAEDDEDSEIESDEAFGDSDNDRFQGYSFRGSSRKEKKGNDESSSDADSDDSNDDEGETLGADAIDLATALDQYESSDDEVIEDDNAHSSDSQEYGSEEDSEQDTDSDSEDGDSEDNEADPTKLNALQTMISNYGGGDGQDPTKESSSRSKISLSDLGLSNISDPYMKQSVKLLNKEEKENRPGRVNKLDVPLARRQQGRLDRSVAYEKTKETLGRWTDTVKQNRRAEHLVFPLPQNSDSHGVDRTEIQPLTAKTATNELESAIMSIMEQSGLSMEKPEQPREKVYDEDGNELSRREVLARKRLERDVNSREAKRAARIKKIKSKSYHRVHRKQRERDAIATREAMEEAGEIDSEAEREAQDRRRALERVGQRHKDSKWAKLGNKAKRAVWDDEFRTGLTEMARKDEELRKRKEGKRLGSEDDETSSSGSDSDENGFKLRQQLDELEGEQDEPQSGLMAMKFMQKAEAEKKKANDDMIKDIRRDLDGEDPLKSDEEQGQDEVGRRQFGGQAQIAGKQVDQDSKRRQKSELQESDIVGHSAQSRSMADTSLEINGTPSAVPSSEAGAWSQGPSRHRKKGSAAARIEELDLNSNIMLASNPKPRPESTPKSKSRTATELISHPTADADSDHEADANADNHLPLAIRDQELIARAFAGEDVVGEFEREKAELAEEEDDKVIDNTLPGWGSWVGEGVSEKEKKRHQGRYLTKVEGIKKKDRKDAKLDRVIVNEKRIKKNDRYLAAQLPHPFESRQQYERSLRLPVGPEWMTKQTFQENTKPRLLMKQGIITPMSKPML